MSYPLPASAASAPAAVGVLVWSVKEPTRPFERRSSERRSSERRSSERQSSERQSSERRSSEPRSSEPRAARRARRRGLSSVVSRVERSAEYRRSIGELHALASSFQRGLNRAQGERWLVLEEALLAHSERLSHAYYHAGFRYGVEWSTRSRGSRSTGARSALDVAQARSSLDATRGAAASAVHVEAQAAVTAGAHCLAALARLLLAVVQR